MNSEYFEKILEEKLSPQERYGLYNLAYHQGKGEEFLVESNRSKKSPKKLERISE
jgi:hypothetical protein